MFLSAKMTGYQRSTAAGRVRVERDYGGVDEGVWSGCIEDASAEDYYGGRPSLSTRGSSDGWGSPQGLGGFGPEGCEPGLDTGLEGRWGLSNPLEQTDPLFLLPAFWMSGGDTGRCSRVGF